MAKITKVDQKIPTLKTKKRVAAYARVSMESERMNHSLSAQISYYSSLIQKNPDWEYAGVYADDGISGTAIAKRDEFKRMISDAEEGKIDIILTKSIQRFARNTVDLLETVRHLKDIGVEVRFEKEHINSMSGDGELMLTILASFAQEEVRSISENEKWSIRKRFKQGIPVSKPRILGYRWEGDTMVVVPEEAAVVKRIYQNFLDGKSRLETERELAAEGITSVYGNRLCDSQLKNILTNISYTGNMLLQKEFVADPITKQRKKNRGELPQYYVENTHEAIIDKATWDYVQEEMARRKALGPRANKSLNLTCFSGIIKCERCGCSFMHNKRRNKAKMSQFGEFIEYWTCGTKKKKGGHCPTRDIPEIILKRKCAEVLGTVEFDEGVFLDKVEQITVPEHGILTFHFKDGTEKTVTWENTLKTESWTDEAKKRASEYRRKHAATGKRGASCFTAKLKCAECGCNFRRQTTKVKYTESGEVSHWRCAEHKGCGTVGIKDHVLRELCAKVLGQRSFDEDDFLARVDYIMVSAPAMLEFHFTDGGIATAEYEPPEVPHPPCSEEQKAYMREVMKEKWTPEKKAKMSESMKQLRKERGDQWRRK